MNAQQLIDSLATAPDLQSILSRMVKPVRASRDVLVWINTKMADALWHRDEGMHIGTDGKGEIRGRLDRFRSFLQTGTPVETPEVALYNPGSTDVSWQLRFTNGRHRFSVLRDMGATSIPVAMDPGSYRTAKRLGLITRG